MAAILDQLVAEASRRREPFKVQWDGFSQAMRDESVDPDAIVEASWTTFRDRRIIPFKQRTLAHGRGPQTEDGLAVLHPAGVLVSAGRRKLLGGSIACGAIPFDRCVEMNTFDHGEIKSGLYSIEFLGPGGAVLGFLDWAWRKPAFRDPREEMMSAAMERDRMADAIIGLVGD